MRRSRRGCARARPLGLYTEYAILEPVATGIVDQGNLGLRVFDEAVVVVPGRHPEAGVGRVEGQPWIPILIVQGAGFALKKPFDLGLAGRAPSARPVPT